MFSYVRQPLKEKYHCALKSKKIFLKIKFANLSFVEKYSLITVYSWCSCLYVRRLINASQITRNCLNEEILQRLESPASQKSPHHPLAYKAMRKREKPEEKNSLRSREKKQNTKENDTY